MHHGQVQRIALARDPFAVQDVELGIAERCSHLVLHNLHLGARPHHRVALLHRADAANVDAHGRVELQRLAAGRRLRIAKHDADLLAYLVNEDQAGARLGDGPGKLAQRLAHQPRLQAHMRIAHLAIQLGLGHQRRHRIHHQHVNRARTHQRLHNLQRLFAIIRLRDQQVVDVHAQLLRVGRIQRVLRVHERGQPAGLLRLRNNL